MATYIDINNSSNSSSSYNSLYGTNKWTTKDGTITNPYTWTDFDTLMQQPSGEYLLKGIYESNAPDSMSMSFGYFKSISNWDGSSSPWRILKHNGYIEFIGSSSGQTVRNGILASKYDISAYAYGETSLTFIDCVVAASGDIITGTVNNNGYSVGYERSDILGNISSVGSGPNTITMNYCYYNGYITGSTQSTFINAVGSKFSMSQFSSVTPLINVNNTFNSSYITVGSVNYTGSLNQFYTSNRISPLWSIYGNYLFYTQSPLSGYAEFDVTFSGYTNNSGINWNFGDGSPNATGFVVNHTYSAPGSYYLTLTASGNYDSGAVDVSYHTDRSSFNVYDGLTYERQNLSGLM